MEVLRIEDMKKTFKVGNEKVEALKGVSFSLNKGEILAVMGSSGSGKSTLLNMLGALDIPDEGRVYLEGKLQKNYHVEPFATQYRSEKIGFVFQAYNLLKDLTVEDNIALPLVLQGIEEKEINKRVEEQLKQVGLLKWRKHRPVELSGGQQQRVSIARSIITKPELLLADEPTGNLDYNTSLEILDIFKSMSKELHQSIIIVTHDPMVASYADRVLFFKDGNIHEVYERKEEDGDIDMILSKFKGVLKKND